MTPGRAAARATAADYRWNVLASADCAASDPVILAEISEFRGRVLYADGRRPLFRQEGGRYVDDDLLDARSVHILARQDGDLVGYLRIRPLPEHGRSSVGLLTTAGELDAALREVGLTRNDFLEVSRWMVAPRARGTDVGATLVVGAWVIGRRRRKQRLIATAGTRDGQVKMLARFGGRVLESIAPKLIAEYDDELVTLCFDLNNPPPRVASKLGEVERLLNLGH